MCVHAWACGLLCVCLHVCVYVFIVQGEASEYMASCDCPAYLIRAEKRLQEESERCLNYMDATTEPKVIGVVQTELISKQVRR